MKNYKIKLEIIRNEEWQEYIVIAKEGDEILASYYTDNKEDAKDTLKAMKKEFTDKGIEIC